ncbi:MAG: PRC-barrel domain-containing protein [Gammaproteobacteria bacterium]|nr:PRC-barrel domain-containing protein [Gammaproteobacteria bacterium]
MIVRFDKSKLSAYIAATALGMSTVPSLSSAQSGYGWAAGPAMGPGMMQPPPPPWVQGNYGYPQQRSFAGPYGQGNAQGAAQGRGDGAASMHMGAEGGAQGQLQGRTSGEVDGVAAMSSAYPGNQDSQHAGMGASGESQATMQGGGQAGMSLSGDMGTSGAARDANGDTQMTGTSKGAAQAGMTTNGNAGLRISAGGAAKSNADARGGAAMQQPMAPGASTPMPYPNMAAQRPHVPAATQEPSPETSAAAPDLHGQTQMRTAPPGRAVRDAQMAQTDIAALETRQTIHGSKVAELKQMTVINRAGKEIGDVDRIVVNNADNRLLAIVDVGGFLGIGSQPIALPLSGMTLRNDKLVFDAKVSADELKKLSEYREPYFRELDGKQIVN